MESSVDVHGLWARIVILNTCCDKFFYKVIFGTFVLSSVAKLILEHHSRRDVLVEIWNSGSVDDSIEDFEDISAASAYRRRFCLRCSVLIANSLFPIVDGFLQLSKNNVSVDAWCFFWNCHRLDRMIFFILACNVFVM